MGRVGLGSNSYHLASFNLVTVLLFPVTFLVSAAGGCGRAGLQRNILFLGDWQPLPRTVAERRANVK